LLERQTCLEISYVELTTKTLIGSSDIVVNRTKTKY